MHIEIQVALNFVISYLYNKLPRRRVNLFGEELERALENKFAGHWYPETPFKGSAYRCLRMSDPMDPVFEIAARESGVDIQDIKDNIPSDFAIWIDPGEVSYRLGEKTPVKILYSEYDRSKMAAATIQKQEVGRGFNPEAQCFRPIEPMPMGGAVIPQMPAFKPHRVSPPTPELIAPVGPAIAAQPFIPKGGANGNVTFTTAMFAQTKFGSTKLKTSGKRSHRMSPTEFSNYIKQRAAQQQQQAMQQQMMAYPNQATSPIGGNRPQRPRSLSPNPQMDYALQMALNQHHQQQNGRLNDIIGGGGSNPYQSSQQGYVFSSSQKPKFIGQEFGGGNMGGGTYDGGYYNNNNLMGRQGNMAENSAAKNLAESFSNFNLNNLSFSNQQLLMAN